MSNIDVIFKTDLIKGVKGNKGDTGVSFEIPTGAVIAYDGTTIPEGYVETDAPPEVQSAIVKFVTAKRYGIHAATPATVYNENIPT